MIRNGKGQRWLPSRKICPRTRSEISSTWYQRLEPRYRRSDRIKHDPLLALRGSGKHIWADEHADEYIRRLREGWE